MLSDSGSRPDNPDITISSSDVVLVNSRATFCLINCSHILGRLAVRIRVISRATAVRVAGARAIIIVKFNEELQHTIGVLKMSSPQSSKLNNLKIIALTGDENFKAFSRVKQAIHK